MLHLSFSRLLLWGEFVSPQDVDKVMSVITGMFKLPVEQDRRLRNRLAGVELSSHRIVPKNSWIEQARSVARQIAQNNGEVTIEDVLSEHPLPDDADPRIVGGVLKHPDFKRVGNRVIRTKDRYKTVGVFALTTSYEPITDWD